VFFCYTASLDCVDLELVVHCISAWVLGMIIWVLIWSRWSLLSTPRTLLSRARIGLGYLAVRRVFLDNFNYLVRAASCWMW
jgi:hypothetical protein